MLLSLFDVKMQMPSLIIVNICVNNHDKGSSIYYVITDRGGGSSQMITDYIGGEGSAETPKNDYVIYG